MGKHSLQRESRLSGSMRGAFVIGALTTGAIAIPAAPAMAATVEIPGVGSFNVPDLPPLPPMPQLPAPPSAPVFTPPPVGLPEIPSPTETANEKALDAAKTKLGAAYSWGGNGPYAFDCSGLVQWSYRQAGIELPRTSFAMASVGTPVSESTIQPGDIVVQNGGSHVAMYAGDGQIVHASTEGVPVQYAPLNWGTVYAARHIS